MPFAQLSFGAYLIHPIVIFVWQLSDRGKDVFRLMTFGMNTIAVLVVSYACALIAALLVELPSAALWKYYMHQWEVVEEEEAMDDEAYMEEDIRPLLTMSLPTRLPRSIPEGLSEAAAAAAEKQKQSRTMDSLIAHSPVIQYGSV